MQEASSLDPAENRARLAELTPDGTDLVVFPEAFARDFGEPGSDLAPYAEPLDGPFAAEVARVAAERGTTVVAGMFERADDPARPYNTLVVRGGGARRLPQDPPLRLLRLPRVRPRSPPARSTPVVVELGGLQRRPDDLLRPAVPRAGPARWSTPAPRCWWCPRPGWPGRARSTTGRTLVRARAIENTAYVVGGRPARPALHRPLDRWSARSATCSPRPATKPETLTVELDRAALDEARRTNPSLANRRL